MAGNSADVGIRIFLDDAASRGLFAVNQQLGQIEVLSKRAGVGFGSMSQSMVGLGVVAGLAASFLLFGGAIVYTTDQAAKFATIIIGLRAATGATDAQLQQMANSMMDLGARSIFSLDEIAAGFTIAGQRGITAGDIIKYVAAQGIALAEAVGVKPVAAFGLLASVMAAFNIPASQAAKTADLLFFAFEHGVPSTAQLLSGLVKVGAAADALRVPLDQVIPVFDTLGRVFGSGAQAGTALYYLFRQIASGTPAFKDEIHKLGLTFYDAHGKFVGVNEAFKRLYELLKDKTPKEANDILQKLFNMKSGAGLAIILQDFAKLAGLTKQLKDSHDALGTAMAQAGKVEDSLGGKTQAVLGSLHDLAILIGGPLSMALIPVVSKILGFVNMMRHMAVENPKAFSSIMLIGAALAALGLIVAIALSPFALFIGIILAVIAIVAGAAAAITWFSGNWARLQNTISPLGSVVRAVSLYFHEIWGLLKDLGAYIGSQFAPMWKEVSDVFKSAGISGGTLMTVLRNVAIVIGAALALAVGVVIGVITGLISALHAFVVGLAYIVAGAIQFTHGIMQVFSGFFTVIHGLLTLNGATIQAGFKQMWSGIQNIWNGGIKLVEGLAIAIFGTIYKFFEGFVTGVIAFFTHLANALVGHSIIPDMLRAILTAFVTFFANIISAVVAWVAHVISTIVAFAARMLATFLSAINSIKALWNAGWAALIALIAAFVSNVIAKVVAFASQLFTHFTQAMTRVHDAISTGISKAVQFFKDLPGKIIAALSGLGDMLWRAATSAFQRFVDGIVSKIQSIKDTVLGIVSWVANHLPQSPAKEGPLKNLDKMGPAFITELARGIEAGGPRLSLALNRATGGMQASPRMSGGGYGGGAATYNLILDGRVLGSWTVNYITGHLQMNGLGRMLR